MLTPKGLRVSTCLLRIVPTRGCNARKIQAARHCRRELVFAIVRLLRVCMRYSRPIPIITHEAVCLLRVFCLAPPTSCPHHGRQKHAQIQLPWAAKKVGMEPSLFFDEGTNWGRSRRILSPALNGHSNVANMIPTITKVRQVGCPASDSLFMVSLRIVDICILFAFSCCFPPSTRLEDRRTSMHRAGQPSGRGCRFRLHVR